MAGPARRIGLSKSKHSALRIVLIHSQSILRYCMGHLPLNFAMARITNGDLSICDLQEKFRPAIHEYSRVIATTQKVLKACMLSSSHVDVNTGRTLNEQQLCLISRLT
jgi:hypothetical protein